MAAGFEKQMPTQQHPREQPVQETKARVPELEAVTCWAQFMMVTRFRLSTEPLAASLPGPPTSSKDGT